MNNKFTAIYTEKWIMGSNYHSLTKMKRLLKIEGETILDMLDREGISDSVEYLFEGHPEFIRYIDD